MPREGLKGVVIGAGFFAEFQAEAWARIPGVSIEAVADVIPGRAKAFAARHGIRRAYRDPEEMLEAERPDFVDIVTRPESHLELVKLAASNGAAAICQKPMAPSLDECVAMVNVCADAGTRLLMHENWRWQPWYREMRRLIEEDRFGRVFQLAFRMRTGDGRGREPYPVQPYFRGMKRFLLYETCVHFLDTFRFLAGEIEWLHAHTARLNPMIEGEDCAVVQVKFDSGAFGLIDANRISGASPAEVAFGEFRLEGEGAMIRMTPDGSLFFTDYGSAEMPHPIAVPEQGYKGDSVKALQEHLAECLLADKKAESEGVEYLKTVRSVFACYESAASGLPVKMLQ